MMDAAPSAAGYWIEPLKGENYHTWKVQMTDILNKLDLWEYVSGETKPPSDTNELSTWKKKDSKALHAI